MIRLFLQRLLKFAAHAAAGIVIVLAIFVGLFRLFLPQLPEYQEEIKGWASAAIGMQVEFTGMDARWGLSGPELNFYGAELIRPGQETRLIEAEVVGVGISLMRLLTDQTLVVDTLTVRNSSIEIQQLADGRWQIQGTDPGDMLRQSPADPGSLGAIDVIGVNIELQLLRPGVERPTYFTVTRVRVRRDDLRLAIDALVRLPEDIGRQASISATQILAGDARSWNVSIEADDLNLAGASMLQPDERFRFGSGQGDVSLALAYANERIVSVTASIDVEDLSFGRGPAFDISGRIDVDNDIDGWLVAADRLRMRTPAGEWPLSSIRLETSVDHNGDIVMLDARASYLNLADIELPIDWLNEKQRQTLDALRPDGIIRNVQATFSDIGSDMLKYAVSAELEEVGFAARGSTPGVRGFSGSLRADHSSGLLAIDSSYATLHLPELLTEPIDIDTAAGTVIWRRSGRRTTILSDSITFRNSVLDSKSDIEIVIDGEASPVIDLASTWSIYDIGAAKRYIPQPVLKPRLYAWFQEALLSGRITSGKTRFNGPLDKFPFDGGEGQMLIEGTLRDTTLQYLKQFPPAEISEMDVIVENAHLYTRRNRFVTRGNEIVDAVVDIPDLRRPVLRIDAYSTGTLEALRDFSANSPIGAAFGGQLERISVGGDASVTLALTVPILDWQSFEFTARILSSNGSLAIEGLNPSITDLSGAVTVEKDLIISESLGGRFLGEAIVIDLTNAPASAPDYNAVAHVSGQAGAEELLEQFGIPLAGRLEGRSEYTVDVWFPRAQEESPPPLSVQITSDMTGMSLDLPTPFGKPADTARAFSGELNFMPGEQRIVSLGETEAEFAWDIEFIKETDDWDLDRGMLVLGDVAMSEPDVRGLHVRGQARELRLEDWLELSRHGDGQLGVAERIRSIELGIDNLFLLGQHLQGHNVRIDRSARDWLVQINGDKVEGSAFVPYDFTADRTLVLDMQRLILPGDEDANQLVSPDDDAPVDPRNLPAITVKAAEFGIGERMFGALEADVARTPEGLVTDNIAMRDASFQISGSGRWVFDGDDPSGFRSFLTGALSSSDVVQTMQRLGYQPGIVSDDMGMLFDVSWSGGPRMDFLDTLNGDVQVRFGSGQLDEVEPGAGRVFGLMSVVALPRRLSLDFRDVFQPGFGFDKIEGAFRIEDGEAFTCNLSLEGPAAAIAIVGRAGLVAREYEQTAIVSANVGNTLPIVGAVVAGPQIGVALLLFSQIFKKPLQDLGQVYYSVSGSWDEPTVESSNAGGFEASAQLALCIDDAE
jgi:uncharacterized protein (TIGR02099 family)